MKMSSVDWLGLDRFAICDHRLGGMYVLVSSCINRSSFWQSTVVTLAVRTWAIWERRRMILYLLCLFAVVRVWANAIEVDQCVELTDGWTDVGSYCTISSHYWERHRDNHMWGSQLLDLHLYSSVFRLSSESFRSARTTRSKTVPDIRQCRKKCMDCPVSYGDYVWSRWVTPRLSFSGVSVKCLSVQ